MATQVEIKHTPGPWEFLETFGRVETKQHVIAYIAGGVGSPHFNPDQAQANGHLIAAAPELLLELEHELEDLEGWLTTENLSNDTAESMVVRQGKIQLLIHRAKGEL
jgi:hypothetical protein